MTMFFDGRLIAHVHVNWLAPVKVRRTLLGGSRRMIVFDDLEASEKIKVYDRGISVNPSQENVYQMLVGYRAGDMWAPQLGITEALQTEAQHFVDCIENKKTPTTDGHAGLRVVRLLEAATRSMAQQGALVPVAASTPRRVDVKKWPAARLSRAVRARRGVPVSRAQERFRQRSLRLHQRRAADAVRRVADARLDRSRPAAHVRRVGARAGGSSGRRCSPKRCSCRSRSASRAAFTAAAVRQLTGSMTLAILAALFEIAVFPRTYSYPKIVAYAFEFWLYGRYLARPDSEPAVCDGGGRGDGVHVSPRPRAVSRGRRRVDDPAGTRPRRRGRHRCARCAILTACLAGVVAPVLMYVQALRRAVAVLSQRSRVQPARGLAAMAHVATGRSATNGRSNRRSCTSCTGCRSSRLDVLLAAAHATTGAPSRRGSRRLQSSHCSSISALSVIP